MRRPGLVPSTLTRRALATVALARHGALAAVLLAAATASCVRGQDSGSPRDAWRSGDYDRAVRAYQEWTAGPGAPVEAHRERARLLLELGRYQEAERSLADAGAAEVELATTLGEVLLATGRHDEAEAAFRRAVDGNADDGNVALLQIGMLELRRGEREEGLGILDGFIDLYNQGRGSLSAEELMAVGDAVRQLAVGNPQLFQDALLAYDEAAARAPGDFRPRLLAGELFLSKYQAPDAHASFDEVLAANPRHPRALLGKARVLDFDGQDAEALQHVRRALETNPDYVPARAFLARLHLKLEENAEAVREVERALEVDPRSLEALSVLAAAHYLSGDMQRYGEARDRALALNPRWPDLYNTVAELAVDQRKYHEGVELAERAVALDSTSWWGWGILGMNQLRIGLIEEGRRSVERAFRGDPHNVWLFNTLELTDTFERYSTVRTPHFELFLRGDEADLLAPYVGEIAEEAYQALAARYGAEPTTPIRLELFPSHGDFSVRTLGLVGLGALGVSFGNVLVMDSPSARTAGEFNWASTLWHEIAHTFHLAMTDHRVPRWFSEGLAVHEQRLARPRWGMKPGVAFLQAYHAGRLHPVSDLNHGFVRPDYPEQILHSYLQASLVFDMIEERNGLDAILAMMRGYREGRTTEELVESVLGTTPSALDEDFEEFLGTLLAGPLAAVADQAEPLQPGMDLEALRQRAARYPGDFQTRAAFGQALLEAGELDDAEEQLRAALGLFPDYAGPGTPYYGLARIHRERGELEQAARALQAIAERNEAAWEAHLEEIEIRRELGDSAGEALALERTIEVFPYEIELHDRLAELYQGMGRPADVVRERQAVVALDPTDKAQAHYRLAAAHLEAGDAAAARTQVLRALEIAPNYEAALELLLRLRGGGR